jgi:hypothetical protein
MTCRPLNIPTLPVQWRLVKVILFVFNYRLIHTFNMVACTVPANQQTAISRQRLGKQVHAETNAHATMEERCFLLGTPRYYITRTADLLRIIENRWQRELRAELCTGGPERMKLKNLHC